MSLSVCALNRKQLVVVSLVSLMLFWSPFIFWERRETVSARADTRAQAAWTPQARSEALRQHVKDACRTLRLKTVTKHNAYVLRHLIFDDKHKVVYCYVPKVACTSWKRVMLQVTGLVPEGENFTSLDRDLVHADILHHLGYVDNPEEKLRTYKKFMFVRHPFERAVSAYKSKLEGVDTLFVALEIKMIHGDLSGSKEGNVTFPEFIRYISDPTPVTEEQRNEHWLPMHELCDPCSVDYDFIGTMENLHEDADYVLQWLGVKELVGRFPAAEEPMNTSRHVSQYLKQLTKAEILSFYAKFMQDYLLFDYDYL